MRYDFTGMSLTLKPMIGVGFFACIFSVSDIIWKNTDCFPYFFIVLISVQLTEYSLNVAHKADVKRCLSKV